jgi:hypothetical protein
MNFKDFKKVRELPLDDFATVHSKMSSVSEILDLFLSFGEAKWAFRGQGTDRVLAAGIERVAIRPGVAYAVREFRRRAHQYVTDLPHPDDDLEWLALMQHHGAPTRLLDWTRSPHVAAFFAAQSSNSTNPSITTNSDKVVEPFVIWAIDVDSVNAEAVGMLSLPEDNRDLSSREKFRKIYWGPSPDDLYLVAAVQPHRMNERLTIQQGLFLCANNPLFSFRRCLAALLLHASNRHEPSNQWLHKFAIAPETRLDLLRALNKLNINSTTLFPGLDGFCQSIYVNVQIQEQESWPGVSLMTEREGWVKGI